MADSKRMKWADEFKDENSSNADKGSKVAPDQQAANDADGWQQYRHWISKAPAPKGRRAGIDPSLYTWKGYRSWSEQVKRDWKDDDV